MRLKNRFLSKALPARLRRCVAGEGFLQDERGVTAIEFALVLPVVLLILLGCFEVPRYVLIVQKISRTASGVADLVAQADEPLQKNQLTDIFAAGKVMMQPYNVETNGKIYVSSINNPGGAGLALTWQRNNGGTGPASKITSGTSLPVDLRPGSNEEVLAAEVYFTYQPIFSTLIYSGSTLYRVSYTRPRNKNLMTPPPLTCTPPATQC
ncbi:TadE/TadG family type IV pilus assembly protein [Dongia sp. agr-C8]